MADEQQANAAPLANPGPPNWDYEALVAGQHGAPRSVLGPFPGEGCTIVRFFRPGATQAAVVLANGTVCDATAVHPGGIFEATAPDRLGGHYIVRAEYPSGTIETHDPFDFDLQLGELDIHLFAEGTNYRAHDSFGAHPRVIDGVAGVSFVVWAPNARRVGVVGDFNLWNSAAHPLQRHENSGIWEIFIPGLGAGDSYKFSILPSGSSEPIEKCDPFAFTAEVRPKTASRVWDLAGYTWGDSEWLARREATQHFEAPMSVYELHLGSWRQSGTPDAPFLNYRDLAPLIVEHVQKLGFTHVELLPVAEHPLDESWGYQVTGYFAPTSRFGTPDDFRFFVDYLHQHHIGVLVDWVPAHFPKDGHALWQFDGTHLFDHVDARQGEHPDWGTRIFNYGRNEIRSFLLSNAIFWLDKYHIDGLRVDAVASMLYLDYSRRSDGWVPNRYGGRENLDAVDFLRKFNEVVHGAYPGVLTIAEESTAWPMVSRPTYSGGLGFSLKWNMGWMHDTLAYLRQDPLYRKYHHGALTFSLLYAFSENFVLPLSHDEVVHGKGSLIGKMPGDWWQKFANLRLLLGFQYAHPGKKLLFMGSEFGQWAEWNATASLDWQLLEWPMHRSLMRFVADLNRLYLHEPAMHQVDFEPAGFEWVDFSDADQSIVVFIRRGRDPEDWLLFLFNFTPEPRHGYRIGVPMPGRYREVLNSDSETYGGSNIGNLGATLAEAIPAHGHRWSLRLTVPPLGMVALRPS